MQQKISIITPTFNSEKTLEKTITSVIFQEKSCELEYIIIDGGSSDRTREIINKYAKYIDIFVSEPDGGAYDAMNKGVRLATGNIIGIINSDDWYNNGAIKIVEQEFSKYPDIDLLYSPIDNYFAGEYIATFIPGNLEKLPIRFTLNHPSCFIKKSTYDIFGLYNLQYKIVADYEIILRLFLSGCKFHYVDIPLAAYSLNGMSSSTKPWDRIRLIRECWQVGNQASQCLEKDLTFERLKAYITWVFHEIFALPIRYFLKPPTARKLKILINKYRKKPVSNDFGKW
jgi:glycosyltransferase involved in cell wall biosynthesis